MSGMPAGLYLHVPFCLRKCAYCDFYSQVGHAGLYEVYISAVAREIRCPLPIDCDRQILFFSCDGPYDSIYVGGGTPNVLPLSMLAYLIETLLSVCPMTEDPEISVEVNPGLLSMDYLRGLRAAGVNRLSIGVQSFLENELRLLGRIHDSRQAEEAVRLAYAAGFENVNLDLIFGLPGQTLVDWKRSLHSAMAFHPAHLSLYALSVEEGTPLARWIACGQVEEPDADRAADMYELAEEMLEKAGLHHYEISNWARPGRECKHNLNTWRNGDYLGFGPAAHSHVGHCRWWNISDVNEYCWRIITGKLPRAGAEDLDTQTMMAETMILGLRMLEEGVRVERFHRRFGCTPDDVYGETIHELVMYGLLEASDKRIRLTPRGRLLGNQIFERFVDINRGELIASAD